MFIAQIPMLQIASGLPKIVLFLYEIEDFKLFSILPPLCILSATRNPCQTLLILFINLLYLRCCYIFILDMLEIISRQSGCLARSRPTRGNNLVIFPPPSTTRTHHHQAHLEIDKWGRFQSAQVRQLQILHSLLQPEYL